MEKISILFAVALLTTSLSSQIKTEFVSYRPESPKIEEDDKHEMDFGVGYGLDYAGLGVKVSYIFPFPFVSLFASGGFNFVGDGVGWQGGMTIHILPETTKYYVRPNLKLMYGVNSIVKVPGRDEYTGVFKGFTPGIGLEFMFGRRKANGLDLDINYPIRSQSYLDRVEQIKNDPEIDRYNESTLSASIGFHHEF